MVFWFGVERWQCCLLALMVSLGLVNFQKESRESLLMVYFFGGSEASICFGKHTNVLIHVFSKWCVK